MNASDFIFHLLIILLAARIFGEIAGRFKVPAVIGEIFAGILIGPSLLGLMRPDETIRLLAEIGIILLLFEVGLETDLSRLMKTGIKPILAAIAGVVAPFIAGFGVSYGLFNFPMLISLFIGGTLTATSIGITVRVMTELGHQQSQESQIVLGAAVIDDIIGVILLAMLYNFSQTGEIDIVSTGRVMGTIMLFILLAPLVAKVLAKIIQKFEAKSEIPGMIPSTIVALLLLFAWIAHAAGAPELLGGFTAGLALARRFSLPFAAELRKQGDESFAHRLEDQMKPIVHLFSPIFFVMVGLSLNLREIDWGSMHIWSLALSLLTVAVLGKLACGFILTSEPLKSRWIIGIAMVPRGEVGLIFAELGRTSGIIDNETYAALIIVIAFTTLVAPFILRWIYGRPKTV